MLKFIKQIIFENKKNYFVGIFFLMIYYILKLFSPIFMKIVIDIITNNTITNTSFYWIVAVLFISPLLLYVTCFVWGVKIYDSSNIMEYQIRKNLMHNILTQFPDFFKKYSAGTLMGRATDNLRNYTDFAGFGMMSVLDGFIYPIFVIGLMIYSSNLLLTLVALLPIGLLLIANIFLGGKFDKLNEQISTTYEGMNDAVLNYTNGLLTIRSYKLSQKYYNDYVIASKEYEKSVNRYYLAIYTYTMLGMLLPALSIALSLIFGYQMITNNTLSLGSVVAFMLYIRYLEWPMVALSEVIHMYSSAKVGKKLIDEVIHTPYLLEDGKKDLNEIQSVTFKNFSYEIDEKTILKNIHLCFKKGDFIGVVGKTGSGKTTLLKQLLRLNLINEKQLYINNLPIENYTIESIRNEISYVAQEHTLFSKTIEENIEFGKPISNLEDILLRSDLKKDVESFKDKEKTIVGEKGIMLSGGQKQRISLARALNKNANLFILDDCLSALDNETQENIINALKNNINKNTLFVASHRLSIFKDATHIIVLDKGEIIEEGTHQQLMKLNGWYRRQFIYQKEGSKHG